MEVVVDYLQADERTGVLSYRRKFPKDLARFIPSRSPQGRGRVELKLSLRTADMNAPGAMDRYLAAERQYRQTVERAAKVAAGAFDQLNGALIQYLADSYLHNQLALDEAGRWKTSGPDFPYASRPDPEEDYNESRQLLESYDREGLVAYWGDWACGYADAMGYMIHPSDPDFPLLCRALSEAACKMWLALDERYEGAPAATPPRPEAPQVARRADVAAEGLTLQAVAEKLMASKADPVHHSTVSQWSSALRFFREVHGTPEASRIDRRMVTEWVELLAQRPAKLAKEERGLPLGDLVARYGQRPDVARLAKKTLRVHLASLATIWNKGQEQGLIAEALANPFKARRSLASPPEEEEGTEFSMSELQAIFSLPVFTSGERSTKGRGEACYWMPLILLWTGMRPEEAAQLLVSDFYQDEDTDAWMMAVTDEGDHPVKGGRRLKSSGRAFPVPSALRELGLLEYLEHLRSAGEVALFPRLTVKSRTKGYLAPSIGEWWSQYLRDNGVHLEPRKGKTRRPYRDFRPTWATAARTARIPEEAMSYLMGHSNGGAVTTRRYGGKHPHASWMAEVAFPKLDMSRVRAWAPRAI